MESNTEIKVLVHKQFFLQLQPFYFYQETEKWNIYGMNIYDIYQMIKSVLFHKMQLRDR